MKLSECQKCVGMEICKVFGYPSMSGCKKFHDALESKLQSVSPNNTASAPFIHCVYCVHLEQKTLNCKVSECVNKRLASYVHQHTHAASPEGDICPFCDGDGCYGMGNTPPPHEPCSHCGGTGKRQHA